ncbi:MAG: family 14 glycosylhydrolase [Myxococcaceae bacterium]
MSPEPSQDGSASLISGELGLRRVHLTAMAPLTVGSLDDPFAPELEHEWVRFEQELAQAKALGIQSISIDVWWGSVERAGDQQFDFRWVDRMAHAIVSNGLMFRPVIAFHACGTNVGDTCHVPLPPWLFARYAGRDLDGLGTVNTSSDLLYVSAQGNLSTEALSVWATPLVLEQYREFLHAFVDHYAHLANQMHGLVIGLGSASELRYPSYNSHDVGAGYPNPGVLQAYSAPARASFRRWALRKYGGTLTQLRAAWSSHTLSSPEDIRLPTSESFFAQEDHLRTAYGRDVFEWYRQSLLEHGRQVLGMAADVIASSRMKHLRIIGRVPGVHWRAGDSRRAELSAGLISTSDAHEWDDDRIGHGYHKLIFLFAQLRARPDRPKIALDFTCLEMGNGDGGPEAASLAESLVFWVGSEAKRLRVPIGGENALAGGLYTERGWSRIHNALTWSHYDELTLLRLHDVVTSPLARREVARLAGR